MVLNEQLQTFVFVAEGGSFSKAAMRLYISAPAVIKLKLWDDPFIAAVPRTHRLAKAEHLSLDDLNGEKVYLFAKGDADSVDAVWQTLEQNPAIQVEGTSFYDMDLFNRAAQQNRIVISIKAWSNVHPSFIAKTIDWDLTTPYGLLYAKKPPACVQKFIHCLEKGTEK